MSDNAFERRRFMKRAGLLTLAAAGGGRIADCYAQEEVKWSSGTDLPKLKAPANACDCHMHIYDARFPVDPSATLRPGDALVDDYRRLQKRIGTTRNVIVTPSTYGTDNGVTLDAMAKIGATARGVAVVNTSVTDAELKRLADLGVRGIRFNLVQAGATTVEMLEPLSKRVNALGWHVQIHMLGDQIVKIEDLLNKLPSPIVFDHLGRIPQPAGTDHPAFGVIRKLIDKGRPGSSSRARTRTRKSALQGMRIRARSRRPTPRLRRRGWCGRAIGLIRPRKKTRKRMMPCSLTC